MSYDNLSSVSQNVLKFYQQLIGEERRIPFIFDDFQFCRSRVIGLDMTDFPKLAEKLSVIQTDRHENLVRPKNILPVREKKIPKNSLSHA